MIIGQYKEYQINETNLFGFKGDSFKVNSVFKDGKFLINKTINEINQQGVITTHLYEYLISIKAFQKSLKLKILRTYNHA